MQLEKLRTRQTDKGSKQDGDHLGPYMSESQELLHFMPSELSGSVKNCEVVGAACVAAPGCTGGLDPGFTLKVWLSALMSQH